MRHVPSVEFYMKVKLLVSIAGPTGAHNAGDEFYVNDATAKLFIERNIAEPIAAKSKKKRLKKPRASVKL